MVCCSKLDANISRLTMCQCVFVWLLLVTLVAGISEERQYCAIRYRRLCQGKGRHVACQYPDTGPGPSCERYTQIRFTNELKHFITHYLNRRRQRIAVGNERVRGGVHLPKPQVMMLVEWDRELAFLAQRLADQCHFVHDDCRATVKFPYAGQTVGEVRWRRSSESDELSAQRAIRRVLDAWWGERRRVQPKQLTAPFRLTSKGTVWGHFSQLAVWNLQAVGCGAVRHGARHPRLLLVCDFSHTNMLGQRTIVPGALAPCPTHTARRPRTAYPALCGPVRLPSPRDGEEPEHEDNYEDNGDDGEDVDDDSASAGEASPTPTVWLKKTTSTKGGQRQVSHVTLRPETTVYSIRAFPEESDTELVAFKDKHRFQQTTVTTEVPKKEPMRDKLERERDERARKKIILEKEREERARKKAFFKQDPGQDEEVEEPRDSWKKKDYSLNEPNNNDWHQTDSVSSNTEGEMEQVIPLTSPPPSPPPALKKEHRAETPQVEDDTTEVSDSELLFRPRWKQTRVRPQRPGAHAILHATTTKPSKKPAIASISLDKEDIDQLFRDTGFNLHWRKPSP